MCNQCEKNKVCKHELEHCVMFDVIHCKICRKEWKFNPSVNWTYVAQNGTMTFPTNPNTYYC